MDSTVFRFKQFAVHNEKSGLKVGTDGVLLGAACSLPCGSVGGDTISILDVGTGTGLVALMMAQRMSGASGDTTAGTFDVVGIDIDARASEEAAVNFEASPWSRNITAMHCSLQDFERLYPERMWNEIISNPPFFENSLKAPDAQRSAARHTDTLSYREVIAYASRHLNHNGIVSVILPAGEEIPLVRYASSFGMYPSRILSIRTTAAKAPKRMIAEFTHSRQTAGPVREELVMMADGSYTEEFRKLTEIFYL